MSNQVNPGLGAVKPVTFGAGRWQTSYIRGWRMANQFNPRLADVKSFTTGAWTVLNTCMQFAYSEDQRT